MNTDYLTELSALYEISSIPTSLISHEELGRLVLDKATRLLGASTALLYRREGDDQPLQFWATRGVPVAEVEDLSPEGEAIARALDEGQPVTLEGVDAVRALGVLPAYYSAPQGLCLPIRVGASVRGLLCALRLTDRPFSRAGLALFNVLADRTGTALETMRLFAETERRYRELQQEITERKRGDEALAQEQYLLQTIMDNIPDVIYFKDTDSRFTRINKAHADLFGLSDPEQAEGKTDFDFFTDEHAQQAYADEQEIVRSGQPLVGIEEKETWPDGRETWVSTTKMPLRDGQGQIIGTFGISRDMTERKRGEEQRQRYAAELERANKELRDFTYIVSHDLRAPLVNIKGFSGELRHACVVVHDAMEVAWPHLGTEQRQAVTRALQEDVPEALEFIDASATRMDQFISALLKLSRLGRRDLNLTPIDMSALVEETLRTLAHQIEEGQVRVSVAPLPQVVAARTSMEQIMGNLLSNAVQYLDRDRPGEMEISGERGHEETTFRVRDNGRGVAEEDMDKVFAPFRRAGRQDTPGEGMGLAYVRALIRRHGGDIWCESELGVGTTFTFTISDHLEKGGDHE